jgi:hypothetical protein
MAVTQWQSHTKVTSHLFYSPVRTSDGWSTISQTWRLTALPAHEFLIGKIRRRLAVISIIRLTWMGKLVGYSKSLRGPPVIQVNTFDYHHHLHRMVDLISFTPYPVVVRPCLVVQYPLFNKNQAAWNFLVTNWKSRDVQLPSFESFLVTPYLWIRGVSLSSIHYNQSRHVYINQRHQYIRLIWS